jgi:hypothetical protein
LDTVGFFSRTAKAATAATKALTRIDMTKRFCSSNIQLLYPVDFFSGWPKEYISLVEPAISKLEQFLRVERSQVDLRAIFEQDKIADGETMEKYLDTVRLLSYSSMPLLTPFKTTAHIQLYDCYRNCLPFLEEYHNSFNKTAFADPYIEYKW